MPGYAWKRSDQPGAFLVGPRLPRSVTKQFLELVDRQFGPTKDSLQGLEMTLWVHVRFILYPGQGVAGSILSSPHPKEYELEAKNATVQQILDRIALRTGGAWVLRPLPPTLANLGGDLPFSVFSDDGQGTNGPVEQCSPLPEALP